MDQIIDQRLNAAPNHDESDLEAQRRFYSHPPSPWMTREEAASFKRVSLDTIDCHRVRWTDEPPRLGWWRYKMMPLGSRLLPRLWREDIERMLVSLQPKR